MNDEMSYELKQYLRHWGKLCLQEGVLYWQGDWARWDHNNLQLVVPLKYGLEAMYEAHNDMGHLGLNQMLDIL